MASKDTAAYSRTTSVFFHLRVDLSLNLLLLFLLALILSFSSCVTSVTLHGNSFIPTQTNPVPDGSYWKRYKYSNSVTENEGNYKKGKAACHSFFGLIAYGDSSITAAMADGRISKIRAVDSRDYSVSAPFILIPVYTEHVTFVYGE